MPSSTPADFPSSPEIMALHGKRVPMSSYEEAVVLSVHEVRGQLRVSFLPPIGPAKDARWNPLSGYSGPNAPSLPRAERQYLLQEDLAAFLNPEAPAR